MGSGNPSQKIIVNYGGRSSKRPGYRIETSVGKKGRTYHSDKPVDGRILVYMDSGEKIILDPKSFKIIGFID